MPKKKISELKSSTPSPSGKFLFEADNGINNYITHDNLFSKYATKTESDEKYFLKSDLNDLINMMYPVGSLYLSTTATHPGTLFGVGEWEQIQDTFLMASGTTYPAGSTGGKASHNHKYALQFGGYYRDVALENNTNGGLVNYASDGTETVVMATSVGSFTAPINGNSANSNKDVSMGHYRSTANVSTTNHLPPYLSIYVYKRKA